MTQESVVTGGAASISPQELDSLRRLAPGRVTVPGDSQWPAARLGWSVNVDQQPLAVVEVLDAADVCAVVRYARSIGVGITAQPVGHGATTAINGSILLRTGALDEIRVDADAATAHVGAGVKWGALLAATQQHSLVGLVGSSNDPSVVGLCLGDGLSWFGRAFGLSANDVLAVDMVTPDGEQVRVTAQSDPDLFWAVRGGGGEFGIVTSIDLALHPAPELTGGRMLWPMERASDVFARALELTRDVPETCTIWANLLQFPPFPEVPEPLRGGRFVSVDVTYLGPLAELDRILRPLREVRPPVIDLVGPVEISHIDVIESEPVDPSPSLHTAALLRRCDGDTINALVEAVGADSGSTLTSVQLRQLGGAMARAGDGAGAAGAIDEPFMVFALGVPMTPALEEAIHADLARLDAALAPYAADRGCFNFLRPHDDRSRAHTPETLARLRALKAERDPDGLIRSNFPLSATA